MNVNIGGIAQTVEITSFDKLGDVKICMLTTTQDNSVGFEQLNDEVRNTIYASFPVDTADGNIATFPDGADNVPVRKLTLNLVPYQGGSGEPAPDNVRPIFPVTWKNVLPYPYSSGSNLSINGIQYTAHSDGSLTVKGTATANADFYFVGAYGSYVDAYIPDGSYYMSFSRVGGSSSTNVRIYYIENGGATSYATEKNPLAVTADRTKTYRIFMRVMSGHTLDATYYPMVSTHVANTDYAPYQGISIRTIGKNFVNYINDRTTNGITFAYNSLTGGVTVSGTATTTAYSDTSLSAASILPYGYVPAGTYTCSGNTTSVRYDIRAWYDDETSETLVNTATTPTTFTVTKTARLYVRLTVASGTTFATPVTVYPQIEIGSEATAFEPYKEMIAPVPLEREVYGGTLEVETGVLTLTHGSFTVSEESWQYDSAYTRFYCHVEDVLQTGNPRTLTMMSSGYVCVDDGRAIGSVPDNAIYSGGTSDTIYIKDTAYSDVDLWKAARGSIQVVYPLATPVIHQLTPTQVKTLLGYNNIWTDSGTVEVQYRANIGLYIQKIIGVSEDDMIANTNIPANTFFFINEVLYYSTTAIASGATIIPGTNCTEMTLADALNALNQ